MEYLKKITLDLNAESLQRVFTKSGDTARTLEIQVQKDGTPYEVVEDAVLRVGPYETEGTVTDGIVYAEIPEGASGTADLLLQDGDKKLSTGNFLIIER